MSDETDLIPGELIEDILDPDAQRRREEEERIQQRARERRRSLLIQIMQNPDGRVWLKEMLNSFHAFETRFASVNGLARDVEGTWLMAGVQKAGWQLWEMLDEADPVLASRLRRGTEVNEVKASGG